MEPSNITFGDEWNKAQIRLPFKRMNAGGNPSGGPSPAPEIITLAGQGATQITLVELSHGLSAGDFVGIASGTWSKAVADGVGPLSSGVVSTVVDDDTFVLTTVGAVRIDSHGWTEGPLYLDQSTAGTATSSAPSSGIYQQVAIAVDDDRIIVNTYVAQNLG
jgi:hypothetical protein